MIQRTTIAGPAKSTRTKRKPPVYETGLIVGNTGGKRIVEEFHYLQDRLRQQRLKGGGRSFTVSLKNAEPFDKIKLHAHEFPDGSIAFSFFKFHSDLWHDNIHLTYNLDLEYYNQVNVIHKNIAYSESMCQESDPFSCVPLHSWTGYIAVNEATGEIVNEP